MTALIGGWKGLASARADAREIKGRVKIPAN